MSNDADGLLSRTATGVRWTVFGRVAIQVLGLGFAIALARLVTPEEFGVYGMAFVVLQLAMYVEAMRLEAAIVQARDVAPSDMTTVAVFGFVFGCTTATVFLLAAPLVGVVFDLPESVVVLRVMSVVVVIRSIFLVHRALLKRRLLFRRQTIIDITTVLAGGSAAVAAAAAGWGVWALVVYLVVRVLVECAGTIIAAPWLPSASPSRRALKRLLRFGVPSSGSELLLYAQFNLTDIAVAGIYGSAPLGFFRQANALLSKPVAYFDDVVNRLAFPVMSRRWHATGDVGSGYLRAFAMMTAAAAPAAVAMALLAPELVGVFYGERWVAAVPLLQLLAPLALFRVWQPLTSAAFHALGQPFEEFRVNAGVVLGLAALLWFTRDLGINFTVLSLVAAFAIHAVATHTIVCRLVGIPWQRLAGRLVAPATGCLAMAAVALLGRFVVPDLPHGLTLLVLAPPVCASYVGVLHVVDRGLLAEARDWMTGRVGRRNIADA